MMTARASGPGTLPAAELSGTADAVHAPASPPHTVSPAGNRAMARALADTAASRTLTFAGVAASRTLARCPGCGGRCGGTCGGAKTELDEDLLASGQMALRRAVLARRALSPRS
jgi:hypothetical protein